jgi:hypothetical protein
MRSKFMILLLVIIYVIASALTYVTFRRYPDRTGVAAVQWLLFYVVTVVYPAVWTIQELRLLRTLSIDEVQALRRYAWAPVIVGGTSLLIGLSLLFPLLR